MPGIVRDTVLDASVGGNAINDILTARVSLGYDLAVSEAVVTCATFPGGGYFDSLDISMNGQSRFSGVVVSVDYSLYPRAVQLMGRGRMFFLQKYRLQGDLVDPNQGLSLLELVGSATATDQQIVSAVLDRAGVGTNGGGIGGTGSVLGLVAPEEFAWKMNESALDYIHKIDKISLGYRTFETAGGQIFRAQVNSRPGGGESLTFTEGIDIREGSASRSVQDLFTAVRVGGYSVGDYLEPRVIYMEGSNPYGGSPQIFEFESEMIEYRDGADRISCESVAAYWLGELNREIVKLSLTTPRDDLIGPGQVHLVQGPGGSADRLGTGEPLWVQRVDIEINQSGEFRQNIQYIGGG